MINKNTNIFFMDKEVPIVDGKDLKEFLPESHMIAIYESETSERYTLRGKKNCGFFCVKRNDQSNNLDGE
jgi:hypothetical protein|tara:strand:- start:993 stop:1202 length:210 start_codon:yes stop_codon:yes gene_type:complete